MCVIGEGKEIHKTGGEGFILVYTLIWPPKAILPQSDNTNQYLLLWHMGKEGAQVWSSRHWLQLLPLRM